MNEIDKNVDFQICHLYENQVWGQIRNRVGNRVQVQGINEVYNKIVGVESNSEMLITQSWDG